MKHKMFCFQCQETAGCTGCTNSGVCGKKPEVAAMQDLLIYVTKGLSAVTTELRKEGKEIPDEIDHLVVMNLFTTITNVNFDNEALLRILQCVEEEKKKLVPDCYACAASCGKNKILSNERNVPMIERVNL